MKIKKLLFSMIMIMTLFSIGCESNQNNYVGADGKVEDKIIESSDPKNEETVDQLMLKINEMTLDEKIGQLVLVGMEGYEINNNIKELINSYFVGGVILYGKNVQNSSKLLSLTNSLKNINSSNKIPLFISVDEEGGAVSRNPNGVKKLPTARDIGKIGDANVAFEAGRLLGQTVKAFGYNMNFAPVLDIDSNPLNPVIGNRSFGGTAEIVSVMGTAVLNGIREEGIIPVVKHFPGHGDTSVDSHIGLPDVHHDLKRIMDFEIVPFKTAIDNGADMVMVAHILMPEIDSEYPASMSHIIITDVLRHELGFDSVVITDDITMGAIEKKYDIGTAAIKSINSGVDIILVGHNYNKAIIVINAIKAGIETGDITLEKVDKSLYRILKLKEKYKLKDTVIDHLNIDAINETINKLLEK